MCERPNFELQRSAAHDSLCLSGACCKTKRNSPSSFFSHGKRPATPAERAQVMHMITRETTQKFEKLQRLKRKFKNKITFPSKLRAALVCAGWRQQGCFGLRGLASARVRTYRCAKRCRPGCRCRWGSQPAAGRVTQCERVQAVGGTIMSSSSFVHSARSRWMVKRM